MGGGVLTVLPANAYPDEVLDPTCTVVKFRD
jgi:hypothetical protein